MFNALIEHKLQMVAVRLRSMLLRNPLFKELIIPGFSDIEPFNIIRHLGSRKSIVLTSKLGGLG